MKKLFFFLLLSGLIHSATAQSSEYSVEDFAASITPGDLRMYLSVLASDALEGRETGTEGNDKAAQFLASQLAAFGIPGHREDGQYYQDVTFTRSSWGEVSLTSRDTTYRHLWDFLCLKQLPSAEVSTGTEIVFAGYGIDDPAYSDYTGLDVRGKAILIYDGEPKDKKGRYTITGSTKTSEWSRDWFRKLEVAQEKGASTVFVIASNFPRLASRMRRFSVGPSISLGAPDETQWPAVALISRAVAEQMIGNDAKKVIKQRKRLNRGKKPRMITLSCPYQLQIGRQVELITGYNVLGYVEGSDPARKDELVILSAHFDHLGKRGDDIFNGANDNGSGTSTVLEVIQAMALAKKKGMGPRRSVLALFVTGEEKGLLGSRYYIEHPVFPLDNTVVDVNVDMVGRRDEKYADNPDFIYVIGADRMSTELHEINETMNERYTQLTLDYTYNDPKDPNRYYYRSDHYNFVKAGIPAIFYFNGTHKDYHRPSDTIEKIDFDAMAKIGKLVFHTAWELANRDARISIDVPQGAEGQ